MREAFSLDEEPAKRLATLLFCNERTRISRFRYNAARALPMVGRGCGQILQYPPSGHGAIQPFCACSSNFSYVCLLSPRLTAVGPFRAGEALDETLEAMRRALATAVDLFLALGVTSAFCRAQRARCAAAILAFPSGLIVRRLGGLNSPGILSTPY